jgi:Spy/CpxP family protein refolding chaperone
MRQVSPRIVEGSRRIKMKTTKGATVALAASVVGVALGVCFAPLTQSAAQPEGRQNGPRPMFGRGPQGGPPGDYQGSGFEGGPPPPRGACDGRARGPMLDEMLGQLNLSAQQQTKIGKALDAEREKVEALHQQIRSTQDAARKQVDALLSAEQRKKLSEMEAQMGERMPPPHGDREQNRNGGRSNQRGPRGPQNRQ